MDCNLCQCGPNITTLRNALPEMDMIAVLKDTVKAAKMWLPAKRVLLKDIAENSHKNE